MRLTIVVGLLEVHVDDTTRPDLGHVVTVDGIDLGEGARGDGVAAVLGEEGRDRVVGELGSACCVAGLFVGRVTAPRVDVVAPEVDGVVLVGTAVEVIGELDTDGRNISAGVANTNFSEAGGLDVCLGIADGGLDVGTGLGGVDRVGNLVTGEETERVGVVGHRLYDRDVTGVELVGPLGVITVDGDVGRGQVGDDVDASVGKQRHALVVVSIGVDGVDTDGVGAELLEVRNVTLAARRVGERVGVRRRRVAASDVLLVCDTTDEAGQKSG